jgi:DNA adenine methylase
VSHDEYREPFVGGASIFLAKSLAKNLNWLNDKDKELTNFYHIIADSKTAEKLYELIDGEYVSKERYAQVKQLKPKNEVEKAFKYFYLNRTSFSGIMVNPRWGYLIGSSLTPENWVSRIQPVAEKLQHALITNLDFRDVLTKDSSDRVLCYIDPPYLVASKSIYSENFNHNDHHDLAELLQNAKFKFVLSYENSDEVRSLYSWANLHHSSWVYYLSEDRRQDGRELIITNF